MVEWTDVMIDNWLYMYHGMLLINKMTLLISYEVQVSRFPKRISVCMYPSTL